jgi:glycosyltransferase involved in cell wall biosynthesis
MRDYLRAARCYLYTGTQPASYTLGLIEAMMTGVPVVSIGPSWMTWQRDLFEAHEIAEVSGNRPEFAQEWLRDLLDNDHLAAKCARYTRERAIALFSIETVGPQWRELLGEPEFHELDEPLNRPALDTAPLRVRLVEP